MGLVREMIIIGRKANYELSVLVDENDYQTLKLWDYSWHRVIGRYTTYIATNKKGKTIYLHRLIMGLAHGSSSVYIDHVDGNGLNNSRTNLRIVTPSDSNGNKRKRTDATTSQYKGVSFNKQPGLSRPWQAEVKYHGKSTKKYYKTEIEAARSYNKMAIKTFGSCAKCNILPE